MATIEGQKSEVVASGDNDLKGQKMEIVAIDETDLKFGRWRSWRLVTMI